MGTTVFSALSGGILTGKVRNLRVLFDLFAANNSVIAKYNDGIPENSRLSTYTTGMFQAIIDNLKQPEGQEQIRKVRELSKIAEGIP